MKLKTHRTSRMSCKLIRHSADYSIMLSCAIILQNLPVWRKTLCCLPLTSPHAHECHGLSSQIKSKWLGDNLGCHQHNSIPTHQHNALAWFEPKPSQHVGGWHPCPSSGCTANTCRCRLPPQQHQQCQGVLDWWRLCSSHHHPPFDLLLLPDCSNWSFDFAAYLHRLNKQCWLLQRYLQNIWLYMFLSWCMIAAYLTSSPIMCGNKSSGAKALIPPEHCVT